MKRLKSKIAVCAVTALMAVTMVFGSANPVYAAATAGTDGTTTGTTQTDTNANSTTTGTTAAAAPTPATPEGSAYVCLGDTYQTQSVKAGQQVTLVLPIVNYCHCPITNVVITPQTSNLVSVWPFQPASTGYTKNVPYISAYTDGADVNQTRADVTYNFQVRSDVMTGYYPLNFNITYLENGETQSSTVVTAYVQATGSAGSGYLEDNSTGTTSKPRIIVTGFETNPAQVCAGDTFTLTIHVKNTSAQASVSNVLFNLQAAQETTATSSTSGSSTTTYDAFLPTSGSSSIYESTISAGETKDLEIEMTARADLTQKPYVLDVNMTYDAAKNTDITDKASVSIPVSQASKFDTGEEAITPADISVGDQSNISFSIYNTGKTTLYNVWVKYISDCVEAEDVYVGTITSGSTGYVDSMVTGAAANDGTVKMEVSYEDDAGNVTTTEKEVNLNISEMSTEYMDEMMTDMPADGSMDTGATGASGKIWIVVAIAAAAAVVVLVIVLKRRKKKKAKAETDDLMDFDEDDDNDSDE